MAIHALKLFQLGKETDRGSPVAATKKIAGALDIAFEDEWDRPEHVLGRQSLYEKGVATRVFQQVALKYSGPAYFEQLLWWFGMGLKGGVSGVQQIGPTAYLWTYSPTLTTGDAPDSYTIEYGDEQQNFESDYCIARSLTLAGAPREPWKIDVDIVGRKMTESAVTAAKTLVTGLEAPPFNKTTLAIDVTWAALGGTVKAATLVNCSLTIPGFKALANADGNDYFSAYGIQGRAITGKLTMLFNATANVERDAYAARTARFVRLNCEGSVIEAGYSKRIRIDMCIEYTTFKVLGEWEGQTLVEADFVSVYDPTGTKEWEITVQNALATIP